MRIGIYYEHISGPGGYPADFDALARALRRLGLEVVVFPGPPSAGLKSTLVTNTEAIDLLHLVGLFVPGNFRIARWAQKGKIPYVCSLLAQHAPALALNHRAAVKKAFTAMYFRTVVGRSAGIHFLSKWEYDLRPTERPHFFASLGVPPHEAVETTQGASLPGFVFFGRNDIYQKGLDLLLDAFSLALPKLGDHGTLRIAGRDHHGSHIRLREEINRRALEESVQLIGETPGWEPLDGARVLVYPSRIDGPPRPVRAALTLGLPVLVTRSTNMADGVEEYSAGWVADPNEDSIAAALIAAANASEEVLANKSAGALDLAQRWAWPLIAEDYWNGYRAIVGMGKKR